MDTSGVLGHLESPLRGKLLNAAIYRHLLEGPGSGLLEAQVGIHVTIKVTNSDLPGRRDQKRRGCARSAYGRQMFGTSIHPLESTKSTPVLMKTHGIITEYHQKTCYITFSFLVFVLRGGRRISWDYTGFPRPHGRRRFRVHPRGLRG